MRIIGNDPSTPRQAQIVASGTLSTGDTVVVNSDGTVSAVEKGGPSAGTEAVFESADSRDISATYDANAQKVVLVYSDDGNSSYGTAVVGTVSGTSISFGTPVVFDSTNTYQPDLDYDANAEKVVIAYADFSAGRDGRAVVGTVSGTSISFGNIEDWETNSTSNISVTYDANAQKVVVAYRDSQLTVYGKAKVGTVSGTSISFSASADIFITGIIDNISSAYDASTQKVVIFYEDKSNSDYGTAVVGTVSGTSISFGTPVVFTTSAVDDLSAVYDANAEKVVVAYQDESNSNYGTAIVGTVSGTSISFGTATVFESDTTLYIAAAYDATAKSVVVAYRDLNNSGYGTLAVGTVSGTSISFETPLVFAEASTQPYSGSLAYDSDTQKIVAGYQDESNSNYGTAAVITTAEINLTAENFIGTAATGAADTQRAKINLKGAVDENQSGLTAGQSYYVQTDGTLGTTPADPSVFAGTAVAATKLIVKG